MGIESTRNSISSTRNKISSLEDDLRRLQTARTHIQDLADAVSKYKNRVDEHRSTINSLGSFAWEGQSVKDFKNKYDDAMLHLNADVVSRYASIDSDLEDKIARIRESISYQESELNQLNYTLQTLLAAQ